MNNNTFCIGLASPSPPSKSKERQYNCELTSELDRLAGIDSKFRWKHYILIDDYCKKQKCLAIRIPGGTLGGIWYDENNIIRKIVVDTKYVVKTYPSDVNEQLKKFVGEKLEFDEVKRNEENS